MLSSLYHWCIRWELARVSIVLWVSDVFLLCWHCWELSCGRLARRGDFIDLVDSNQFIRCVIVEICRSRQGSLCFNFILVEGVTLSYEIKSFVWLDHQLFVSFGEVFGFDYHDLLLLELHIAACSDYNPILAWVVLLTPLLAFCQLFFKLEVGHGLLFKLWEVKWVFFVGRWTNFCLN